MDSLVFLRPPKSYFATLFFSTDFWDNRLSGRRGIKFSCDYGQQNVRTDRKLILGVYLDVPLVGLADRYRTADGQRDIHRNPNSSPK